MRILCLTVGLALLPGNALASGPLARAQANMAHVHIGHVMDSFQDTPNQQGLLPAALAEAKIVAQHAALAAKATDNLDAMKLHAGHVIHAVDPGVETKGPGLGYGVKKAAASVARHVELAARAEGASANVKTHATYVAAYANNVVKWADEIISLAQRIRVATSAPAAAALVSELNDLSNQLMVGLPAVAKFDAAGGLQLVQLRMEQMKKGEGL